MILSTMTLILSTMHWQKVYEATLNSVEKEDRLFCRAAANEADLTLYVKRLILT